MDLITFIVCYAYLYDCRIRTHLYLFDALMPGLVSVTVSETFLAAGSSPAGVFTHPPTQAHPPKHTHTPTHPHTHTHTHTHTQSLIHAGVLNCWILCFMEDCRNLLGAAEPSWPDCPWLLLREWWREREWEREREIRSTGTKLYALHASQKRGKKALGSFVILDQRVSV